MKAHRFFHTILCLVPACGLAAQVQVVSPKNAATVSLVRPAHAAFLAQPFAARVAFMTNAANRKAMLSWKDRPQPVTLQWYCDEKGLLSEVRVTDVADGRTVFESSTRHSAEMVTNLEVAREYAWSVRVRAADGRQVGFASARFRTDGAAPRFVRVPGVPNMRDLGGWVGAGGRRVRQGLVYRSAGWNDNPATHPVTNADGKVTREWEKTAGRRRITDETADYVRTRFCIRTDLDLRSKAEVADMTGSPAGPDVRWVHVPSVAYAQLGEAKGMKAMAEDFRIVSDPRNLPLVFHCIGGADRTGCLALVLNALLGVAEEDLMKDWQITGCHVSWMKFNYDEFLAKFIAVLAKYPGKTLNERVEAYVRACGVLDEEIAAWRALMLEPPSPAQVAEAAARAVSGPVLTVGCVNVGARHYGDGKTPKSVYDAGWRDLFARYPQDVFFLEESTPDYPPAGGIAAKCVREPISREYITVSNEMDGQTVPRNRPLRLVYDLGGKKVAVYGVHLAAEGHVRGPRDAEGVSPSRRLRRLQYADLVADARAFDAAVFCGDFNAQRPEEYAVFTEAGYTLTNCSREYGQLATLRDIPADNIIVSPGVAVRSFRMLDGLTLDTDHRPLVAELVFRAK